MKFRAIVAMNDPLHPDCPYKGCIRVRCPSLFGFSSVVKPGDPAKQIESMKVGLAWVKPHYIHPMDFYIPEIGEGVYIEYVDNGAELIWTGVYPSEDFLNNSISNKPAMEGINTEAAMLLGSHKTRIFGTRSGSSILIEDTFANEMRNTPIRKGKMVLTAGGKNKRNPTRQGVKITLDSAEDLEKIEILVQNKAGVNQQTITLDNTKNAEKIVLTDKAGQTITLDSAVGGEKIQLKDKQNQTITLDPVHKLAELVIGEVSVLLDNIGKTIELKDGVNKIYLNKNIPLVSLTSGTTEEVTVNGASHKVLIKNAGFTLNGVISDLITQIKAIVTAEGGSPLHTHSVGAGSQATLTSVKAAEVDNLLE